MISTNTRPSTFDRSRNDARSVAGVETDSRTHMRAAVRHRYGPADLVGLEEMAKPAIGEREVLVRVHAAGVDRGVWHVMTGTPYLMRIAGYGLRAPKNPILGMDLAGVVEAVGQNVTKFLPGDKVFGVGNGTFAEYARAREDKLALKPEILTFEQAAAVAISGTTALQALRDNGRIKPGQHVLIIGASGGVGTYAVQIAKAFGATVTGVCSTTKVDMVRALGSDYVLDYTHEDFAERDKRYDLIIDIGGNSTLSRLRRALMPEGCLVIVGGEGGGRWFGGIDRQLMAMMLSSFGRQKLGTFIATQGHEDLMVLKELIDAGKVTPVIDRTYALDDVSEAIRYLEAGHARGKVVVTVTAARS